MPSRQNIALRRKAADAALNEAIEVIAGHLGIAIAPPDIAGTAARDPEFRAVLVVEHAVSVLQQINAVIGGDIEAAMESCADCTCADGACVNADITITINDDGTFEADPPELVEAVEVVDESGTVIGEAAPKRRSRSRK